ncbi:MAG TPA: DUF1552 domain-containing protein [Polyangiaceae bacterium]|nr:DUF1552 domain-containing protein [Polyangiaceae bacterium]
MTGLSNRFRRPSAALSRRRWLMGSAGLLGLPWLETFAAKPALAQAAKTKRLVIVFRPNGVWPDNWWPTGGEQDFVLKPATAPLEAFRDRLVFLDGVDMPMAERGVSPGDEHQRGMGACLTGRKNQEGTFQGVGSGPSGYADGASIDQYLAGLIDRAYQAETGHPLPIGSLNLGVFSESTPSSPNKRRMIFSGPGQPVPSMQDPQQVFDTVFAGRSAEPSQAAIQTKKTRAVLDSVLGQLNELSGRVGAADRERLAQHAELVRSVELRLDSAGVSCTAPAAPAAIDDENQQDARAISRLQIDLMVSALACDLTRVTTLQYVNSDNQYGFPALPDPANDHSMGHTEAVASTEIGLTQEQGIARRLPRHVWYAEEFKYLLTKMDSVVEGDGTLLDNSVVLWMSDLATGGHSYKRMPYVLAGKAGGSLRTGRLVKYDHRTNCDLFVALLNLFGFDDTTFGDPEYCSGALPGLV